MKHTLHVDTDVLEASWAAVLSAVRQGTERAVRAAHEHAGERAVTFLIDSVYGTEPGNVYERTERALGEVETYLDPTGPGEWTLTVEGGAPYAMQIELGNRLDFFQQQSGRLADPSDDEFIPEISLDELALLMLSLGDEVGSELHPGVFFERSGQNYQEPGPHVTPAAVAGAFKFAEELERVWEVAAREGRQK